MHVHFADIPMTMYALLELHAFSASYFPRSAGLMHLTMNLRLRLNSVSGILRTCPGTNPVGSILGACRILHNKKQHDDGCEH
jgi:hypothetical protein